MILDTPAPTKTARVSLLMASIICLGKVVFGVIRSSSTLDAVVQVLRDLKFRIAGFSWFPLRYGDTFYKKRAT